jgi:ABC-type transport system substrate-binding protein
MSYPARKLTALACAMTMLLSFCGCGRQVVTGSGSTAASGDSSAAVQTVGDGKFSLFYNSQASLNPMKANDANNQLVCGLVYENMLDVDNGFELQPGIVTKWTSDDGIKWHKP